MSRNFGKVEKGWGHEEIWASNDKYCGKILHFKTASRFSMHFHAVKDETWYVLDGKFLVQYINTGIAATRDVYLNPGDTWHNPPLLPHRITCLSAGRIIEVSTADSDEDNYRISVGDSQR